MTKARMRELRAKYPKNYEYQAALQAEIDAEIRIPAGIPWPRPEAKKEIPPYVRPAGSGISNEDYYARLYADVFKLGYGTGGMTSGGNPADMIPYFEGHKPRFDATLDMFHEFCDAEEMKLIYDLGTGAPFISYYFNLTQGAEVRFGHLQNSGGVINERVRFIQINLARDPPKLTPGDLTICTECLEHLPVNLYRVRKYLCDTVKPGRFLILSFPLNGKNAWGYDRDGLGNPDHDLGHVREFTQETAIAFCKGTGFKILKAIDTYVQEYGGVIKNVLMRRPA